MSVRLRTVAAIVLLAAMTVVLEASPASAHAILLRTDPAPQTTVARPPTSVRLFFSEAVEVTFGAVRVFDVDGHRIDRGTIRRASGNREVVVATPGLKAGTYTVTWRAVSADGHPVHGGFTFYAVQPSTISPVAVVGDVGAGRVVGWGFGVDRFLWFAAFFGLAGIAVVRRWVWTPAIRQLELGSTEAAARFRLRAARGLVASWGLLVATGLAAIVFQSAAVSGLSFAAAAKPSIVRQVLSTTFGHLWVVQLAISVVLGLPVAALVRRRPTLGLPSSWWLGGLGGGLGGLAVVAAVNGHARTLGHAAAGVPSLALHLVTVAVWVGGLGALVVVAGPAWRMLDAPERSSALRALVPRFSRLAMGSVALVIVTGTINALIGLASVSDLWKVPYGRVVLAKVVLLAVALCFGARHLVTPRRLEGGDATGAQSFRRTSAVELAVLVGAVGLAAGLIALVPGRSLALQASGAVAQEHKSGAYTIQLFVDPGKPGTNDIHITYSNAQGLGAAEVVSARASFSTGTNPPRPLSLRLISAGHFVATADLRGDRYTVVVRAGPDGGNAGSTFHLTIHAKG